MSKPLDLPDIAHDPESLNRLSVAQLRALWGRCCPKTPPSPHRAQLTRDLAFLAQSRGQRLPGQTEALIRMAIKAVSLSRDTPKKPPRRPSIPGEDLPPGSRLVRDWGGQSHEVTVLGGGWFQYQGESYKSLTLVARAITGAHWSGPRFFGLHRIREKGHD